MPKRKPQTLKQRLDNLLKGARASFKEAKRQFAGLDTMLDAVDPKEWDRLCKVMGWSMVTKSWSEVFQRGSKALSLGKRRLNEANRLVREIYAVTPAEYSKAIKSLYDTFHHDGVPTNNRVLARMKILAKEVEREVARKEMAIRERERFAKLAREKAEARQLRKSVPPTSLVSNWWETSE